ncbi:putative secreted protein (Por secretion system target) [Arenibacter algicola]|uniref:Secreted protein (Por secretion system target) n=1 Tax=Arenibacter algicola TaxID=616991 RepID=A0ABY3AER1_9FLAO
MKSILSIVFFLLSLNLIGQSYQVIIDGRLPPGNQNGEINYGDGTFTARGGSIDFSINNFSQENVQFREVLQNQTLSLLSLRIEYYPTCEDGTFGAGEQYDVSELIPGPNQNRMGISQCDAYISVDAIPENMSITTSTTSVCAGGTIDLLNSDDYPKEARSWRYHIPAYQGNPGLSGYIPEDFLSNDKKLATFTVQELLDEEEIEARNYIGSAVEFYMGFGAYRFSQSVQVVIDDCTPLAQTFPVNASCFDGIGSVDIQFDRGLRESENEYLLIELNNISDNFNIPLANNEINSLDLANVYNIPEGLIPGSYEIQFQSWVDPENTGTHYPNGLGIPVNFEILTPSPIVIDNVVTIQNPSCPGEFGVRTIEVSGGQEFRTGIYQYTKDAGASWETSTSANSITYTDLEPGGNYTFGVKLLFADASECISGSSIYQSIPDIINPILLATSTGISNQPSTSTSSDGIILAEVTGGTQDFTFELYSASDPVNPISTITQLARIHQFTNLGIGLYFLKIRDNNGCEVENENTPLELVAMPPPIIDSQQITEIGCLGDRNGSIIVDISEGITPYNYQWTINGVISPIQTTGNQTISLNNLSEPGEYILKVASTGFTDFNDPSGYDSTTITLNIPEEVIINSATQNNISCFGAQDGSIAIIASGGLSYEYKLDFFDTWKPLNNGSIPITNGGFYDVYLRNQNNCEADPIMGVLVTEPDELTVTSTSENAITNGGNEGGITLNILGGIPFSAPAEPYAISWNKDGQPFTPPTGSTSSNLIDLEAGEYTAQISDANGCSPLINLPIIIDEPGPLEINSISIQQEISCLGAADGIISANVTGTSPITFEWRLNGATFRTLTDENTLSGIGPGDYQLFLNDGSLIDPLESEVITIASPLPITTTADISPVSCFGGNDGRITINAFGGTGILNYNISGLPEQTSPIFDNLITGTYSITITDENNCTSVPFDVFVPEPTAIQISDNSIIPVSVAGGDDGAITLTIIGGTEPYGFTWLGPNGYANTTMDITSLEAGTYSLEIRDINGCFLSQDFEVSEPGPLAVNSLNTIDVDCNGNSTGSIYATVTGTAPIDYTWSLGGNILSVPNVPRLDNIPAGNYTLMVDDATDTPPVSQTITVNQPLEVLTAVPLTTDVSCNGSNDGSLQINATGGTAPYTYSLDGNNYQNSNIFNNLSAGYYTIYVLDNNGCIITMETSVNQPSQLNFTIDEQRPLSQANAGDGAISITASGGTGNLTYSWNGPGEFTSSNEDISNLEEGDYILTITDENYALNNGAGCILVSNPITITEPGELQITIDQSVFLECYGDDFGEIIATVQGGVPPYTYEWFQVTNTNTILEEDTEIIGNLSAGQYYVRVTDTNGVSANAIPLTITQPDDLEITVNDITQVFCQDNPTGAIAISVLGGTGPYSYLWSNGSTSQNLIDLEPGEYTLEVYDDNGCFAETSVNINPATDPVRIANAVVNNNSQYMANDGSISLQIDGGATPYIINWLSLTDNIELGNNQEITNLPMGSYKATITDANGCYITETYVITEPDIVEETITQPSCSGQDDGSIEIVVNQGNGIYTYTWNTGATSNHISDLAPGNYTITITGFGDGPLTRTYVLDEQRPLEVDLGEDKTLCAGQELILDGTIDNATATYSWTSDNGFTSSEPMVIVDKSGNYTLTLSSQNGCSATGNVFVDVTDDEINAEFAVSSQVFVGEPLIAVDISYPLPETQEWIFPDGGTVIKQDSDEAELIFNEAGEYEIGIITKIGECWAQQTKKVLVIENEAFTSGEGEVDPRKLIEDFIIYPNPTSGEFIADITLSERGNISIKIFNFTNNALMASEKARGESSYTIPFDISGLPSGVYAVLLETPFGNSLRKVILK